MIACAESGVYADFASMFLFIPLYSRRLCYVSIAIIKIVTIICHVTCAVPWYTYQGTSEYDFVDDMGMPRMLNSGCLLGRAGQVRKRLL